MTQNINKEEIISSSWRVTTRKSYAAYKKCQSQLKWKLQKKEEEALCKKDPKNAAIKKKVQKLK